MPLPELTSDESRDAFIERCMVDPAMQEFGEDKQRYAVCARQYTKARIARDRAADAAELDADLTPTEEMAEIARRALKWRKENEHGGTKIGAARARDVANRRPLSARTIKRMRSYFDRHEADQEAEGFREGEAGFPSAARIAWDLWGGSVGREWAEARTPKEEAEMQVAPTPSKIAQLTANLEESPGRRYRMLAYTGQEVDLNGERLVFDLAGVELGSDSIPILRQHDPEAIVGHSLAVSIDGEQIVVELQVSPNTDSGREVLALFGDGFPWQASVGMVMQEIERFSEGEIVEVNGRTLEGPIGVVRRAVLREASFVPLGADAATSVAALAAELQEERGEDEMTEEQEREVVDRKHMEMLDALRDLIDALPDRLEMAVAAFMEGQSVVEAKAALADKLLVELADKSSKLETASQPNAELRAEVRREVCAELRQPVDASLDVETDINLSVKTRWDNAVSAELALGVDLNRALSNVVRKNPELQAEFIASANQSIQA